MSCKPSALLEGWLALYLHGRPYMLLGFATGHPRLGGYRRHIQTSRVLHLGIDHAETLNTRYDLRFGVTDMTFEDRFPVRIEIGDLVARSQIPGGQWDIFRGNRHLANVMSDYKAAILRMLAFLDEAAPGAGASD
jgi:hypothetical protein